MFTSPKDLVHHTRKVFNTGRTKVLQFRKIQLKRFEQFLYENETEICTCLQQDLHKPLAEALLEVKIAISHLTHLQNHLDEWCRPEAIPKRLIESFFHVEIVKDPLGVVLVLTAWNVPLLTLLPVAGAIAAGNTVVIKPSHNSLNFTNFLTRKLPNYLDYECYPVLVADIDGTKELLKERFDYIYYTGSWNVGQLVHGAANRFLTPTTLELGGKSPIYLDSTVDFDKAVKRIIWGKFFNLGQTCIAPDYLLCSRSTAMAFIKSAQSILKKFYGIHPEKSAYLARIINVNHYKRLRALMQNLDIVLGGEKCNENDLFIEPTIALDVDREHPIMQEEIFGPILPIILVDSMEDAFKFINSRGKPLVIYVFSRRKFVQDAFLKHTTSGAITFNDTLLHLIVENLPFGGVGDSGMGTYKGRQSFDTFTHRKSVLKLGYCPVLDQFGALRYPPYTTNKSRLLHLLLKSHRNIIPKFIMNYLNYFIVFLIGLLVASLICNY